MNYGLVYKLQIPDTFRLPYLLTTYIYKNRFPFLGRKGFFLANAERSEQIKTLGAVSESV